MHPNPSFRTQDRDRILAFARGRGFGTLAVAEDGKPPLMSHVPFVIEAEGALYVDMHLVRSNPILPLLEDQQPARLAVSGPDSYISPDWYGAADQVPTWNYVAVHLIGRLERQPQDSLRDVIDRQTAAFETRLYPKKPWTADKMDGSALDRMMRMIVPVRLWIDELDGTWKLGQNKPDGARVAAANEAENAAIGAETALLAQWMRDV
ncbi:FMN-binding negative transcriptional regulator [Lutimaribacter marinistellae]|uniref:FMN-binding negative transcriptional regulator n=1 Tax=Lutimaribacter marinistellae TaxID=1820329 RepID=A0ABV7TBJ3_9RHOB